MRLIEGILILVGILIFLLICKLALDWVRIWFGVSDELTKWRDRMFSRSNKNKNGKA